VHENHGVFSGECDGETAAQLFGAASAVGALSLGSSIAGALSARTVALVPRSSICLSAVLELRSGDVLARKTQKNGKERSFFCFSYLFLFIKAMSLYPIPDVLVLGDSYDQYVVREKEYLACNPGSFGADSSFVVIRPSSLEIEESRIPDENEENVDEIDDEDRAAPLPEVEADEERENEELREEVSELQTCNFAFEARKIGEGSFGSNSVDCQFRG
jgi:hypothetical protein